MGAARGSRCASARNTRSGELLIQPRTTDSVFLRPVHLGVFQPVDGRAGLHPGLIQSRSSAIA